MQVFVYYNNGKYIKNTTLVTIDRNTEQMLDLHHHCKYNLKLSKLHNMPKSNACQNVSGRVMTRSD